MSVKEMPYDEEDLDIIRSVFPGLNIYFIALLWEFAEYCLRLQTRIEELEKVQRD